MLVGRSGGQTLIGGTASGNKLILRNTSHATKGRIDFLNIGSLAGAIDFASDSSRTDANAGTLSYVDEGAGGALWIIGIKDTNFAFGRKLLVNDYIQTTRVMSNSGDLVFNRSVITDRLIFGEAGDTGGVFFRGDVNAIIGGASSGPGSGTKGWFFEDGTAPATLAVNTAGLYADDISGNVSMHAINENGDVIKLIKTGTYTPTNVTADRSFDADTVAIAELADVVCTLISYLQLTLLLSL